MILRDDRFNIDKQGLSISLVTDQVGEEDWPGAKLGHPLSSTEA